MRNKIFELPDGKIVDFDIKDEGQSVCVLALTEDNNVILARQFRPGPEKVLLELPGGGKEPDESAIEAIQRELLEETGYTGEFTFVGTNFVCAYSTGKKYNFVATHCQKVQASKGDDTEFIVSVEMPLEEFKIHLRSGELTDVATGFLGLAHLGLL